MATDEELVQSIRQGEMEAFDELYRRHSPRLYSYILRYLTDRDEAEDLLQEVFLTVLRDGSLQLRRGRFRAWLFTVARNSCLTHLRNEQRRTQKAREQLVPPAAEASPEEAAQRAEQVQALQDALSTLPENQHETLLLKQVGHLTYHQIAEIQGVPEGTVKSRLHNAIQHLQRWITRRARIPRAGETA